MKAVVYKSPYTVSVEEVEDPQIQLPTDGIIKVTSAAICGSDLHMYEGRTDASPGMIFGHEIEGVVEEVGDAVLSIQKDDRVVLPFNIACGVCFNCVRGYTNSCLIVNPDAPHAAYGYADMGPFPGGQAQYVRVPHIDFNALKLPGALYDEYEDDFVLLADVFPTGFYATELASVYPGDTVAIYGAGSVGLLSAYSAILKGASDVYVVDSVPSRLKKAEEMGGIAINFQDGDPVDQIIKLRLNDPKITGKLRPGEDKMLGVMCGIDAVGYEALDESDPERQNPMQVIKDLVRLVNPTGHIGIVGMYASQDPAGINKEAKLGNFVFPLGEIFDKGITIGTGQTPVKKYNTLLRDLVISGRAKPGTIVSKRISIVEAPDAYEKFDNREEGYIKIIIDPQK